jgi:hypothetical protein
MNEEEKNADSSTTKELLWWVDIEPTDFAWGKWHCNCGRMEKKRHSSPIWYLHFLSSVAAGFFQQFVPITSSTTKLGRACIWIC